MNAIQMFEFQAISNGTNAALGKVAEQSSTLNNNLNRRATAAVDGDNSTFSHTMSGLNNTWWYVDLGQAANVQRVIILNRWCTNITDPTGCLCRLSDASLSLLDESNVTVSSSTLGNTCNETVVTLDFCS